MKFLYLVALLVFPAISFADTSPSCTQLPNLACVAGDTYSGTHDFGSSTVNLSATTLTLPSNAVDAIGEIATGIKSGNGSKVATVTGSFTTNNCIKVDANGNLVDSGGICGGAASTLDALTDVTITSVANANMLLYENASSQWKNFAMSGDATISAAGVLDLATNQVELAELVQAAGSKILGNPTGSTANVSEIGLDSTLEFNSTNLRRAAISGDITISAGSNTAAISSGVIVDADISVSAAIKGDKISNSFISWQEAVTGSGTTRTVANAPRNISANRDAILVVANGIVQKQVAAASEGINEFSRSSTTLTWAADPGTVLVWYETDL
jgi:hypothetical protein